MSVVRIKLDKFKRSDGLHSLKLYIHVNGTRGEVSLFPIHPKYWNDKRGEIKGDSVLSGRVASLYARASDIIREKPDITAREAIQIFKGSSSDNKSLGAYLDGFIKRLKSQRKEGNLKVYRDLKWQLEKFTKLSILLSEIDYVFIKRFDEDMIRRKYKPNSRGFYHAKLRSLLNHAAKEGVIKRGENPYLDFQIPKERTKKRHLTKSDLTKIVNYKGKEQYARSYFLWCFIHCGIDVVDFYYLTEKNLKGNRLRYNRRKTNAPVDVLLLNSPDIFTKKDYRFFIGWRKRLNKKLRNMASELDLDIGFNLTTKVVRHTWAQMAKEKGGSVDMIGEMLGHRPTTVTGIYLGDYSSSARDRLQRKVAELVGPLLLLVFLSE